MVLMPVDGMVQSDDSRAARSQSAERESYWRAPFPRARHQRLAKVNSERSGRAAWTIEHVAKLINAARQQILDPLATIGHHAVQNDSWLHPNNEVGAIVHRQLWGRE